MFLKRIFLLICFLFLGSCIGTIEDKNPETTQSADIGESAVAFNGLISARAISNTKVELYFSPASGAPKDLTYLIYVDDSDTPLEVKGSSLTVNDSGQYRYPVDDLEVNRLYQFRVGVRDSVTGAQSDNDKVMNAKTFANITADFNGISKAYPAPGNAGTNSIEVEWIPAVSQGSQFLPRPADPVAYEVSYLAASDGQASELGDMSNSNIVSQILPTVYNNSPQLSLERQRTISGLQSGERYFIQVRAIHKSYGDFGSDPNYKREQNTKFLAVRTLENTGFFDFNMSGVRVVTPPGQNGLNRVDIRWDTATGGYNDYRLYYERAADPDATQVELDSLMDPFTSDDIDTLNLDSSNYETIAAGETFTDLTNLDSYAYYQAKVVACGNVACDQDNRIASNLLTFRVVPEIAAFNGLKSISNPSDVDNQDKISLSFDPPVTTTGYITDLELYCYSDVDDSSPVLVPTTGSVPDDGSKPNCAGLTRETLSPSSFNQFSTFDEIEVSGLSFSGTVADNVYCFSLVPVIEGNSYSRREMSLATIRCARPEIQTPSIEEFTGASSGCSTTSETLTVNWEEPTGGLYKNFEIFYKVYDGNLFKFSDAVDGATGYSSIDGIAKADTSYEMTGLTPGERYQFGVLAYTTDSGGDKTYSEFNPNIRDCLLELPVADFQEWVDIFAVGPKEDGRIPLGEGNIHERYIAETLDDEGLPIEVDLDSGAPSDLFTAQFGSRSGANEFNGVYGSLGADPNGAKHQISNSGIVRIGWKDIVIDETGETLTEASSDGGATPKNDRTFGYKVYRSADGKRNWAELTSEDYDFQTSLNSGLVVAENYNERVRPNAAPDPYDAVFFTDYSVDSFERSQTDFNVDRARVYYYKVVPVYAGKEISYTDSASSSPQNIIKVTLPPKNNALVHRLMANRLTCLEMGKEPSDNINLHYTCSYNGLGSRGLGYPWMVGETVYDVGGDLLVDRFEMGCNISRGDFSNAQSEPANGDSYTFDGTSSSGEFKGCLVHDPGSGDLSVLNPSQNLSGPSTPSVGESYESFNQLIYGDCVGTDHMELRTGSSVCADPAKRGLLRFVFPGARPAGTNIGDTYSCDSADNLVDEFFSLFGNGSENEDYESVVAQSEFAGVYYIARKTNGDRGLPKYRSGGSSPGGDIWMRLRQANTSSINRNNIGPGSCFVNLPIKDGVDNLLKPRWLPVNKLRDVNFHDDSVGVNPTDSLNLVDMTIGEILSNSLLYDTNRNLAPDASYVYPSFKTATGREHYDANTKLARVYSSNSAKLPPLESMSRNNFAQVCSTYEVEVGQLDQGGDYVVVEAPRSKNLLRKKEQTVSAAWPAKFIDTLVLDLEQGIAEAAPDDGAFAGTANANTSCNGVDKNLAQFNLLGMQAGDSLDPRFSDTSTNPALWSGSSFFDASNRDLNTQNCQSRFGIQDIVGNRGEYASDMIYCDYSGESMYLGATNDVTQSVAFPFGSLSENLIDEEINSWVLSSTETGRCSVVSTGDDRLSDLDPSFTPRDFETDGMMLPVVDALGNLNTDLVLNSWPYDPMGPEQSRSGDGHFLDFGQKGFGPPIALHDTLALNATTRARTGADSRRGKFFSPVLGIPLECAGGSCLSSTDSMLVTTEGLRNLSGDPAGNFDVPDFFVGNSQVLSDGMSEMTRNLGRRGEGKTRDYNYTYVDSIDPSTDNYTTNTRNESDMGDHRADSVNWSLPRNWALNYIVGGSSNSSTNGRYSTRITNENRDDVHTRRPAYDMSSGRCSIMINQD